MQLPLRLARADRGFLTVIALAFATSLGDAAIIPVLPEIRDGFGLNGVETGMKWLSDKSNCLTVRSGESYCRN